MADLEFRLPDLGEGLIDAEIVSWHVAVGDHVVADQPLVTVETDKAVVDIPAPHGGRIEWLHAEPGDLLAVGAVLVTYAADDGETSDPERGSVVGELLEAPIEAAGGQTDSALDAPQAPARKSSRPADALKASPKARLRAQALGVDLQAVTGTGPNGTIQLDDVESMAAGATGERLRGVRRAMAERMADAHARVARATVTGEADVCRWTEVERPMPRLVRAVVAACHAEPRLNSHFDDRAMTLTAQPSVSLGIAMESSEGLFVPVLKDAEGASQEALTSELARLEAAVADRSIRPAELRGQTISLSNFGAVAGLHAEMIVVPPQVAIVGAGRLFERPAVPAGTQRILPLSVSFDHRVVTGVEACRFLAALITDLELTS